MSIIREVLGIPNRSEALVKELSIIPPSDPVLPYRIIATMMDGRKLNLEAYSIVLDNAKARMTTINQYHVESGCNFGYAKEIKMYFPNGAWIILDWGVLFISD